MLEVLLYIGIKYLNKIRICIPTNVGQKAFADYKCPFLPCPGTAKELQECNYLYQ